MQTTSRLDSGVQLPNRIAATAATLNDDPALSTLLHSHDANALLQAAASLLASRGVRAPWGLPELMPLSTFALGHLKRKRKRISPETLKKVKKSICDFGNTCPRIDMQGVRGEHLQAFVDQMEEQGLAPGTIHLRFGHVAELFARAQAMGVISVNPAADIELPDNRGVVDRLPMEDSDLTKLLAHLEATGEAEWGVVTRLSRFAGLRLGDAATFRREWIVQQGEILLLRFSPQKTAKRTGEVELPVFEPLRAFLAPLQGSGPICPTLATMSAPRLSTRFSELLDAAGVARWPALIGGRNVNRVTHHSLRHAFCTDVARRGVPAEIARSLSAHSTERARGAYLHLSGVDLHRRAETFFA